MGRRVEGRRWPQALLGAAILAICLVAAELAPAWVGGREIRVNETTAREQRFADIVAAGGGFAVAWESGRQDGQGLGVYVRRFSRVGRPRGGEVQVNTTIAGDQSAPALAEGRRGGFVVVWSSGRVGSRRLVYARRFSPRGVPSGVEIPVSTGGVDPSGHGEVAPEAATGLGGGFTVVWESGELDSTKIFARRFDAFGEPLGAEVRVTSGAIGGAERAAAVAPGPGRGFTVVWEQISPRGESDVFARRFDAAANPLGGEIPVATSTEHDQSFPAIAPAPGGGSVIVWQSYAQDGSGAASTCVASTRPVIRAAASCGST